MLSDTRSSVDLNNANLVVKGKFDVSNSYISLTNTAKIYTTDFTLNNTATMNFIGVDTGFGYINASSSASFNGVTNFQLIGAIAKNDNMSYLFLESKDVSGNIKEGEVTVVDYYSGLPLTGYTSNIVKVGDKYFLVFGEANNEGNENYPNANAQPPGGHLAGYENGIQPDGDTEGGDNQGGGETTPPSTPPTYDNPKDAIHSALKDAFIISDNYVGKAVNDIEKQFALMQDERKTYQGSLIYHNMLGRIANNLNKPKYAFNTKSKFASLASYYKPYYVNLEEQESDNVYISALAGYSNYKNSSGSEFGLSFGYDKEILDEFFAGVYASISKSYINTEGMNLDGFNYSLGLYSRAYLPYSLELDTLAYY